MDNYFTTSYKFMQRYSYPILLVLFLLWMCIGIFPLQCYETDGQEIILGCDVMYREGWSFPPVYSYEYRMQPLTTILVVALKHLLPFFTCERIYCALTVVFSLVFLFGCITFARHITKSSKTMILIAAMLLPEMYAIAMYPNTAIPAAACFVWALILLSREHYWQTALLLCVAVLFRLDIVIVYPAVLPLMIFEGKSWRHALCMSAILALTVIAVPLFFFWLMGADALNTFGDYQEWNGIITRAERVVSILGFYSLAYLLLLPLGIVVMMTNKRWKALFLVLLPILLLHGIFSSFGNASKHFLYNAPFVIIAGVWALEWLNKLVRQHPVLKWIVAVGVVVLMTVSVRKSDLSMPWMYDNPLGRMGIVKPLYSTERAGIAYTVGIGAGYQLVTGDEDMLLSGHLFYPWYIHTLKRIINDWHNQQKAVIDTIPTSNIMTLEYGVSAPISYQYMTEGYHFRQMEKMPKAYRFTLSNSQRELHFWRIVLQKPITSSQEVADFIDSVSPDFLKGDAYLISAPNHYNAAYFVDELLPTGRLEKKAERLYQIKK